MDKNQIEKIDLDKVDWRGSREFFESLGEALDKLDDKDESYDFTWVGKRKAIIEAGSPINKTLRPDVENSKNWDTTENLFIEGDNLDALKLLQESYLGKVKMIYIDPPYNTGKDFVYHDNFKTESTEWDENTEYKDESGNIQFKKNEKTNGRYHSDWLSMMYPRLKLARNLLADDGVIFISIGDDEQANLRKICDEIFGEDNFIGMPIRKKNKLVMKGDKTFKNVVEPILIYSRNKQNVEFSFTKSEEVDSDFSLMSAGYGVKQTTFSMNQLQFRIEAGIISAGIYGNLELINDITVNNHRNTNSVAIKGEFKWSEDKIQEKLANNAYILIKNASSMSMRIHFVGKNAKPLDYIDDKYGRVTNEAGFQDLKSLDLEEYFDYPKPVDLVRFFANIVDTDDCIVLDFFSGSSTTAHAIMQLNSEDNGNRKWIMVQLPETTDENSEAFKAGYKTIPEISRERIRRAGDKIASENPGAKVDYGFRALKIADTNYKEVYKSAGEYEQSTLLEVVDNIKDDRTELDLLYGILTQSAFELNRPLETRDVAGVNVYLYDYFSEISGLVACFAGSVPEDTIKAIAKLKPLTAVFRDSSFTDSQAKVNLAEHFRILSPDTKVKVI
jgi:adenine-specific DNA-methyltransferase